jgi:tetratricopeptide (TPR) repeat protein
METLVPQLYMNWAPLRALRDERWKYIEAPKPELYDLAADPAESRNLHDERPQTVRGLRQQLEQMTSGAAGTQAGGTMDRETLDKLASLGYVAGGAEPVESPDGTARPDPKDMVALFNRLRRAPRDVQAHRYAETLPVLRDAIAKDSRNAFAQILLGTVYMGMGDYRAAIGQYRKHLELVPSAANTHALIATCYEHLKDSRNAMREADAALAIDPKFSDARLLKARVLAAGGDYPAALAEAKATVEADPVKPRLRFEFAKLLAQAGQPAAAEAEYRSALELQPNYATALAGLGTLYAREGRDELAVQMLTRAVQVAPHEDEARFNLAMVYERMGRLAEARAEYQQLVTAPTTAPAVAAVARKQLAALGR